MRDGGTGSEDGSGESSGDGSGGAGTCCFAWLPRGEARSGEVLRRILEALCRDQREPWP